MDQEPTSDDPARSYPLDKDPAESSVGGPARVLSDLAATYGISHATGEIERRLEQCRRDTTQTGDAIRAFESGASDLGLRVTCVTATLATIVRDVDHGRPAALVRDVGGKQDWLVIRAAKGDRFERAWVGADGRRDDYAWVPLGELREELGDDGAPFDWLLVDPSEPAADAVSHGAPLHPLRRLLRFLRPDRSDLLAVLAFSVATGVLLLATPVAVQALVNFVALGGALPPLIVVALLLFLGLALAGLLTSVQTWIVEILQRRIFVRAVAEVTARLPRVRFDAYDAKHGPELVNRFFDVITIQKASANLLLGGLGIVLSVLVGLTVLAFYHPLLLAFDILLLVAIITIVLGPLGRGIRTATEESSAKYAMIAWLEELADNPLLFKSGGSRRWIFERSDLLAGRYVRARSAHFRVLFGQVIGALLLQVLASTALLGIGGLLVMQGSLTLGQLVAAELIVTVVVSSVAKLGKHVESFYDLMAAVNKVGKLLDLPIEELGDERYYPESGRRGAALHLSDVTCSRPTGSALLESVSLEVPAGSSLGVTGPSGSGKSTLVQLLWRLRQPSRGTIRVDGHDLRVINVDSLRDLMAVASPAELVEGTIEENVRLHRPRIGTDAVRAALDAVGLTDVVAALPDEIGTVLLHGGRPLSEGELARLLVARAIVGRPHVLVVDGLLDGLSEENRARLCDVLFAEDASWTLVITSNVPDVLERCSQVLQLGAGGSERSAA